MKMNLRGVYFEVNIAGLERSQYSRLSRLSLGEEKVPLDGRGCYFYDRNPAIFHCILDFYSTGTLDIPEQYSCNVVKEELEFWELEPTFLSEKCLIRYEEERAFLKCVDAVDAYKDRYAILAEGAWCKGLAAKTRKLWNFLENPKASVFSLVSITKT